MSLGGRTTGPARNELLKALRAGVSGTFEALASHSRVQPEQARRTLVNLCREGVAAPQGLERVAQRPGRPRVVYGLRPAAAANDAPYDPLSFARQVWR